MLSTLFSGENKSILIGKNIQGKNIDTIFCGNLYWDLKCELYKDASYPILDSIILVSKHKSFDTCRITVFESILKTESKSCANDKAQQIHEYFTNFYQNNIAVVSNGIMSVSEKKRTKVVIELF